MDKIRIVFLGGLDESYKNCCLIEINDDIFVIQCGIKFPDVTNPGIDYVMARIDYLIENKNRVKAYFLTNGHDSVIGGIPYIIDKVPAPIYCTDITKIFLLSFCKHNHLDDSKLDFHLVEPSDDLVIAGHKIQLFETCTNIAKSFGVALSSDQGNIIYLANNVLDNNNDVGFSLDTKKLSFIASQKVLVLLQDSSYADRLGYTNPNYKIIPLINKIVKDAQGRLIIALESPDIYNIIATINECVKRGRKIILYDKSTKELIDSLVEAKLLSFGKNTIVSMEECNRIRAQELAIIMTAFGAKMYSKLALLATHNNDDQIMCLYETDTVIIASHNEHSDEIARTDALNELYRNDCKIYEFDKPAFLKMHSSQEDIKSMLSIFKPRYYIPMNSSFVKLLENAKIALSMNIGLNHNNVFIIDNGNVVEFDNYFAKILPHKIITGDMFIDGKGVGDVARNVLDERTKFSDDGVIILAATISKSKRDIVAGPDIQSRGLVFVKESDTLMKEIERVFVLNIKQELLKDRYSLAFMENSVKEQIFKAIRRATLKSPIIIPIIVETE